jgi:UDP-3-O-[3-hydroxymyristoyl] N-acetylglucosamine deacetylase/3-hydroxyacyl-[acyl-carrier-protein] dehydratase
MTEKRRSLTGTVSVSGVGIHTGAATTATLRPAPSGSGVVFRRVDLPDQPSIPASVDNVCEVDRRTSLGNDEIAIHTVEHVLAAVVAQRIDDLIIDVDGPELPLLDGSADPFFRALQEAGPTDGDGQPTYSRIRTPFTFRDGDASYIVAPSDGLRITVTIDWVHPLIGRQSGSFDISAGEFADSLARSRTFGFASEIEELRSKGLARGASAETGIVLTDGGLAAGELLWPDEFVRHKTVDLLGDLALLNGRFKGEIVAFKPSHRGNVALVQAIRRTAGFIVPPVMGIQEILGAIPHRYPMLLVDRITELEQGKRIVGIKNVTTNEPFFQGHFPEHPIMPGVLIIEAMGQAGGMLLMGAFDDPQDKVVYFMAIDNVKFRRPVIPGDQIRFELEMVHFRGRNCRMRGVGYVDGERVAEAEMTARVIDR